MAVFDSGSIAATEKVKLLIHVDSEDEFTECFTAESSITSGNCVTSTTICIQDVHKVLYTFQQPNYIVYESTGRVTLTLSSNRPIPSEVQVHVDTIFNKDSGNTSG